MNQEYYNFIILFLYENITFHIWFSQDFGFFFLENYLGLDLFLVLHKITDKNMLVSNVFSVFRVIRTTIKVYSH